MTTFSTYSKGATEGATATFGDYKFLPQTNTSSQVTVIANPASSRDYLVVYGSTETVETATGPIGPYREADAGIQGFLSKGILSSEALPPISAYAAIDLSGMIFQASLTSVDGYNSNATGSLTSLKAELVNPAAVPEASTWVSLGVLLGLGGVMLAVRRRRVVGK